MGTLCVCVCSTPTHVAQSWPPPDVEKVTADYPRAVCCYGLSAMIEMLGEPLYVVAQNKLLVGQIPCRDSCP